MNKNQFISFMDAPEKMSGADALLLNDVIKQFPFFQTAHLLHAKSLHNTQSINYNSQLKITAAYVSDRKILYQLITNKINTPQEVSSFLIQEKQPLPIITKEAIGEAVAKETEITVEELTPINASSFVIEEKQSPPIITKEPIGEAVTKETEISFQDLTPIKTDAAIIQEVSREENTTQHITQSALESEEELHFSEKPDILLSDKLLEKEFLENVAISVYSEKTLYELPEIDKEAPPLAPQSKEEETTSNFEAKKETIKINEEPTSFTDWLKNISTSENIINEEIEDSLVSPKKTDSATKLSDFDLIDRFINESPKISKPKTEFYNPVNMAKQSVAEDISFVSETLAKIYELQGNYSKALAAYENLRLKYPEKRLYFASQIKNLKKIINLNNIK